jgi:hypothetical protein
MTDPANNLLLDDDLSFGTGDPRSTLDRRDLLAPQVFLLASSLRTQNSVVVKLVDEILQTIDRSLTSTYLEVVSVCR